MTEPRRIYKVPDDFEATVRILTKEEGGRRSPPFNGVRWDFRYFDQPEDGLWMIWPEFLGPDGQPIADGVALIGCYPARMYVVSEDMREHHRSRVTPGVGFLCYEGLKVCAAGVVTQVTGLTADRLRR